MFTYLFDGFLRRVFSLLRAGGFIKIVLAWRHRYYLFKILSASSPGVWHEIPPICSPRHLSSKLIFLFPISAWRKRVLFPLYDSSQSSSLFLLPCGHRMQTSVGFHSVGDPFGLLSLSPEWDYGVQIAWPTFFTFFDRPAEVDLHSLFLF